MNLKVFQEILVRGDMLYSSEIHTLQAIGRNANINLTELAEKLDISKSGASKFVLKLLEKDLITKNKLINNKKEVVFNLTEKGLIAFFGHEKFDKEVFDSIYQVLTRLDEKQIEFIESFFNEIVLEVVKLNNK